MPKFEIAKLKLDLPKVEVPKSVYAGAGAAGLAVETVKGYVGTVNKLVADYRSDVTAKVADYQKQVTGFEPKAFAGTVQSRATARLESLTAEAKARRAAVEERVGGLQADAIALPGKVTSFYKETATEALETYQDLAKRGAGLVAKLRREAPTEVSVAVKGDKPVETAEATATTPGEGKVTVKAPAAVTSDVPTPADVAKVAKKSAAKKAPAVKKASTAKTAPAKKASTAKKAPAAKKTSTAKATPAKSATSSADKA